MKRLLVLLTVMVAVLFFTAGGFAQSLTCHNCKCPLRNIPCASDSQGQPGSCSPFDFDLNAPGDGYSPTWAAPLNCRAIFAICDCPDPTVFAEGLSLQLRMEILVSPDGVAAPAAGDHGAYWSGAYPGQIMFTTYPTLTAACADTQVVLDSSFGAQTYYLPDGITPAVPYTGSLCAISSSNRATILLTDETTPYVLTGDEGAYWTIDIPPMRIAPASIAPNSVISVKITLIDLEGASICAECTLCDCVIEVARVCPTTTPSYSTALTFNYFTSLAAGDYWNGIAIANPSSAAGTCTLTAYQLGSTSTATTTVDVPSKSLFVDLLENLTWTGSVNGSACYITATCDYAKAFGFAMMANGDGASMGYAVP